MKKGIIAFIIIVFGGILFHLTSKKSEGDYAFESIEKEKPTKEKVVEVLEDPEATVSGNYLGSDFEGNYVWGGAMNLAWSDLSDNIIQEPIVLNTEDEVVLDMVEKLNNAPFSKDDLDEESYYIKSGYGQETLDTINRESREKFPSKSFSDLEFNLAPVDIIAYAYFLKEVEYIQAFDKEDVLFEGTKVAGFKVGKNQQHGVRVVEYKDDDHFIVKLALKDNKDELYLAKGFNMTDPQSVVEAIALGQNKYAPGIKNVDRFQAPNLSLDMKRDYKELVNKYLKNDEFVDYFIAKMFEKIKFDMDYKGARVENEGVIIGTRKAIVPIEQEQPRNFVLDKPYWVVMKRSDSSNPYFILGINNTALMEVQ